MPGIDRVIGLGNRMRSDDGAGLEVIRQLREGSPAGSGSDVLTECTGDASALIELWQGQGTVVVVDASMSGHEPGSIRWLDGFDVAFSDRGMAASSHALSLREAVELGTALGQLPRSLQVVAIEGESFGFGATMAAPVAAATRQVTREIAARLGF